MLSRVADSLYWLGRYVERAENLARMVEVTRRDALETFINQIREDIWKPVIYATSLSNDLTQEQEDSIKEDPAYYITLAEVNRFSSSSSYR